MTEHLHSSFIPGCFRCAIGLDEIELDGRVSILRKDLEQFIAALEDRARLRGSLDKIRAWSHWHKEEARTQLRGSMKLIHDEALAALGGRDG